MFHPSTARAQRARRRCAVAVVVTGLLSAGVAVAGPVSVVSAAPVAAANVIGLHKGDFGDDVRALQNALNRAGIGVKYGVDGYFGSATQASVRAFQRYKHLPVTGAVDAATAAALGFAAPTAPTAPATAAPAAAAAPSSGLAQGARGAQVRALQQALIKAGVPLAGGADGIFGTGTTAAVKAFQRAKGIAATGIVDAATAKDLGLGATAAPKAATAPTPDPGVLGLRLGSQGPAVAQVQQAIIAMGWPLARGADGNFGVSTQRALMAIQRANGLKVTGAMNIATARLLKLTQAPAAQPAAAPAPAAQPAATGATAAGYPTFDEHGARVVALQNALAAAGVTVRGGADGVFGSGTLNALLAFQRAKGLPATGKVDAATAAALGVSPMNPPAAPAIAVALEAKPVQGPCYYGDSWLAARGDGRVHLGVDILAAEGNQVFAVAAGTVSKLYTPEHDPLTGNGVRITRADGTYFFYGHMSALAPGIALGTPVGAGQLVGYVGHTGNAGVNHLHLEIHPGGGSAVNPYPIVKAVGAC
jgi:peptidoglycan hydrolase-like protein with peptidoglycan-binding domain